MLSIFLFIIVIGCSKKAPVGPSEPVVSLNSEQSKEFIHSLPNIRDAVISAFGSLNIFFTEFITEFKANKVMIDPGTSIAKISEKAVAARETLNNIDLIVGDFNNKKAGAVLRGSDSDLANEIASELDGYLANKNKLIFCVDNMEKYADFMELTAEREDLIRSFTSNMEKAGNAIEKQSFDTAISLGQKAKSDLQRLNAVDLERSKMGIVEITSDILMSWDLHLEAMNILLALWNDLKANNINAATEKAQQHYNAFNRANSYGEKELPVSEQAVAADAWLNANVGGCRNLLG